MKGSGYSFSELSFKHIVDANPLLFANLNEDKFPSFEFILRDFGGYPMKKRSMMLAVCINTLLFFVILYVKHYVMLNLEVLYEFSPSIVSEAAANLNVLTVLILIVMLSNVVLLSTFSEK